MAEQQSMLSKDQMKFAADLEQRNTLDYYEARVQVMELNNRVNEFKLQNKFADAQHKRDLGMLAATGEEERKEDWCPRSASQTEEERTITTGYGARLLKKEHCRYEVSKIERRLTVTKGEAAACYGYQQDYNGRYS